MPIKKLLNRIRSQREETKPKDLYQEMMTEIRDGVREQNTGHIQPENLWDAAFKNGLDQQLSENPDLATEFLIITDRGPTWHYQKYLSRAEGNDDVLSLVALSALINDALH